MIKLIYRKNLNTVVVVKKKITIYDASLLTLTIVILIKLFSMYSTKYLECLNVLGMEDGTISDGQITASSEWGGNYAAHQGRLHFHWTLFKAGGWVAATDVTTQWLQIDLGSLHTKVTRVATQGRNAWLIWDWVTKYKLQYSNDGLNFQSYREPGEATDKVK